MRVVSGELDSARRDVARVQLVANLPLCFRRQRNLAAQELAARPLARVIKRLTPRQGSAAVQTVWLTAIEPALTLTALDEGAVDTIHPAIG